MKYLLSILVFLSVIGMNLKAEANKKAYKECGRIFCTDIFDAIRFGNVGFVERYIAAEADVNIRSSWITHKATPLHWAADYKQLKIAQLLISAGADANARSIPDGTTPLHIAAWRIDTLDIAKLLVSAGANVNAKKEDGKTPLDYALMVWNAPTNNLEMINFLRSKGAVTKDGQ